MFWYLYTFFTQMVFLKILFYSNAILISNLGWLLFAYLQCECGFSQGKSIVLISIELSIFNYNRMFNNAIEGERLQFNFLFFHLFFYLWNWFSSCVLTDHYVIISLRDFITVILILNCYLCARESVQYVMVRFLVCIFCHECLK